MTGGPCAGGVASVVALPWAGAVNVLVAKG